MFGSHWLPLVITNQQCKCGRNDVYHYQIQRTCSYCCVSRTCFSYSYYSLFVWWLLFLCSSHRCVAVCWCSLIAVGSARLVLLDADCSSRWSARASVLLTLQGPSLRANDKWTRWFCFELSNEAKFHIYFSCTYVGSIQTVRPSTIVGVNFFVVIYFLLLISKQWH